MIIAPIPKLEHERIAALHALNILDSQPEEDYNDIVELAGYICRTPISHISFIETNRSWHKAMKGMAGSDTPRPLSFCSHTISEGQPLIISDARTDERFACNPYVLDDPGIRFYAGFPLLSSSGHAVGTLCVVDTKPRELDEAQLHALDILARQVMKLLEERLRSQKMKAAALHEQQRNNALQELISTQRRIMAILGHDTRGPLFYINLMIKDMMTNRLNEHDLYNNFQVISNQLDSTLIMVEDLLDWSKVIISNATEEEQVFAVKDMLHDLQDSLLSMAEKKGILMDNHAPDALISRKHERITRFILRNLMVNAIKFSGPGTVKVEADNTRSGILYTVADSGIGMTPEQVQKLLNKESISTRGTANEPGSGLGYLLLHEFLQQVDGKLDVVSQPGKGTVVTVLIPAR